MTLEQYFQENIKEMTYDFRVRPYWDGDRLCFYIHPLNKSGITVDYYLEGNELTTKCVCTTEGNPWPTT